MAGPPKIVIGICAYNEEKNIGHILRNLVSEQGLPKTCRILVVCSGCTDRTPQVVKKFQAEDSRIEPIFEERRTGKASALNKIFRIARESEDVLVLVNADALPRGGSVMTLVSELERSDAGAVFAQPVPFEGFHGTCYGIVRVIWRLHHMISLRQMPKLSGELCAIRASCLQEIPGNVATDEPYIELAIRRQGYRILYVPVALVNIRCPTNVVDLLKQRRRIWVGHMQLQNETGFKVATTSSGNILKVVSTLKPTEILYLSLGTFLEAIAYLQAKLEVRRGAIPFAWEPIRSTKT
jgi:cellulose synthase/poly-beta-1,6-N-acetylglucosamine synthase-like glycosyltransferase